MLRVSSCSRARPCMGMRARQHGPSVLHGYSRVTLPSPCAIKQVNAEQLMQEIENRTTHLIIDFYATWCGPCKLMDDELKQVDEVLGSEIRILKVDTELQENKDLSNQLQIEGLPTVVLISVDQGKEGLRMEGVIKAQELMETLSEM